MCGRRVDINLGTLRLDFSERLGRCERAMRLHRTSNGTQFTWWGPDTLSSSMAGTLTSTADDAPVTPREWNILLARVCQISFRSAGALAVLAVLAVSLTACGGSENAVDSKRIALDKAWTNYEYQQTVCDVWSPEGWGPGVAVANISTSVSKTLKSSDLPWVAEFFTQKCAVFATPTPIPTFTPTPDAPDTGDVNLPNAHVPNPNLPGHLPGGRWLH